jgi:hypothetical protein
MHKKPHKYVLWVVGMTVHKISPSVPTAVFTSDTLQPMSTSPKCLLLTKVITNILVNRMTQQLEKNTSEHTGRGKWDRLRKMWRVPIHGSSFRSLSIDNFVLVTTTMWDLAIICNFCPSTRLLFATWPLFTTSVLVLGHNSSQNYYLSPSI